MFCLKGLVEVLNLQDRACRSKAVRRSSWSTCSTPTIRSHCAVHTATGPSTPALSKKATSPAMKLSLVTKCHIRRLKPLSCMARSPARCIQPICSCSATAGSSSSGTPSHATDQDSQHQQAEAYGQLPPSFWDERCILYNRMRHERDRANRRARLKQLREAEEEKLSHMPPDARAAYESEMTALRIAAAKHQKQVLKDALRLGLKVVIDCSYCLPSGSRSSSSRRCRNTNSTILAGTEGDDQQEEQQQWHQEEDDSTRQELLSPRQVSSTQHVGWVPAAVAVEQSGSGCVAHEHIPAADAITASTSSRNNTGIDSSNSGSSISNHKQVTLWQRRADSSSHEVRSLAKQIELSMSLNRRSSRPVALTVTSFTGNLESFARHMGAHSWPINKHAEHVLDLLPAEQIVVLSPDADTPLLELHPGKAYVIGGIVDRSVCKGLTAGFGAKNSLEVVRLPVLEHAEQLGLNFPGAKKRPVLNVSDAVVALIEFQRTGDWVHALEQALPARRKRG